MARAGEQDDPPVPAPTPVRRYLGFQRFPERAAEAVRQALGDDEAFRVRVRDAVAAAAPEDDPEATVGEAGWLLLDRPDDERLAELLGDAVDVAEAEQRAREDRRAGKRLVRAEKALEEAAVDVAAARTRAEEERIEREAQAARSRALEAALDEERRRSTTLAEERAEAVRQLERARHLVAERAEERRTLRARVAELQQEVDRLRHEVAEAAEGNAGPAAGSPPTPTSSGGGDGVDPAVGTAPSGASALSTDERRSLARAIADASAAASAMGEALARAGAVVGEPDRGAPGDSPSSAGAGAAGAGAGAGDAAVAGGGGTTGEAAPAHPTGRRIPTRLPVGMFDDTVEATSFLVRLPGAVLVVDGYNVSMSGWADQPLAQQRRRLVEALRNLQARTGVEPLVVFDGADVDSGPTGSLPRSVQVRFSPPGVIADDVVVELVDRLPADRSVVVATSDRELRGRVHELGANTVSAAQLVELLGR